MMQVTHTPAYGQFYLQDPVHYDEMATARFTERDFSRRFHCGQGIVSIFVISEFSPISVEVELLPGPPEHLFTPGWDRIIECTVSIKSSSFVLAGCPDGPHYGRFGEIPCTPGEYAARVFYGGQTAFHHDGSTGDFYRIELWRSEPFEAREIFPGPSKLT
ncbi:MAG: hypothetical protein RDV48_25745 [Candidatus Eremiobacteraeota bacterium]|nr:hypothetical protein [Candidatus Eremiobacteraeota bacterium]